MTMVRPEYAATHATIVLALYNSLREEIKTRSTSQAGLVTLNVTAIGVLGGVFFGKADNTPEILLLIPMVSSVLGMLWTDHAINIANLGHFIQTDVKLELMKSIDLPSIPDYEVSIRRMEKRAGLRLFVLGVPILLIFAGIPLAAMLYALYVAPSRTAPRFLSPAIVSGILLVVFLWLWIQAIGRGGQLWIGKDAPASNASMLGRWKREVEQTMNGAFPGNGRVSLDQEEVYRLREENRRLQMERDTLKKALGFFASESK
jgi:hypothetical protein